MIRQVLDRALVMLAARILLWRFAAAAVVVTESRSSGPRNVASIGAKAGSTEILRHHMEGIASVVHSIAVKVQVAEMCHAVETAPTTEGAPE